MTLLLILGTVFVGLGTAQFAPCFGPLCPDGEQCCPLFPQESVVNGTCKSNQFGCRFKASQCSWAELAAPCPDSPGYVKVTDKFRCCSPSNCWNCPDSYCCQCDPTLTCNGNGMCNKADCQCNPGFSGLRCEFGCDPTRTCTGHGKCNSDYTCACDEGWWGKDCSQTCPKTCGNNGMCTSQDKACRCAPGYVGDQCQFACDCNQHGLCTDLGKCECDVGYVGTNCEFKCSPNVNCGNRGTCRNADGGCQCNVGYVGTKCEYTCSAVSTCSSRGTCDPRGICVCAEGYGGSNCQWICRPGLTCSRGFCNAAGSCTCTDGFQGERCDFACSSTQMSPCSGNGVCQNGVCMCNPGYVGAVCAVACRAETTCSGRGICLDDGSCQCRTGYVGLGCEFVCNSIIDCSGKGTCNIAGRCDCQAGYYGRNCSVACNSATTCNTRGACNQQGQCDCFQRWGGPGCLYDVRPLQTYCGDTISGLACLPGIFKVGVGYDALTGQSKLQVKTHMFSGGTFKDPLMGEYDTPSDMTVVASSKESSTGGSNLFRSVRSYRDSLSLSIGLEPPYLPFALSMSEEIQNVQSVFESGFLFTSARERELYQVSQMRSSPTSSELQLQLSLLPQEYRYAVYRRFIVDFGTHWVTSASFGGQVKMNTQAQVCYVSSASVTTVSANIEKAFGAINSMGPASFAGSSTEASFSSDFKLGTKYRVTALGGNSAVFVSSGYSLWAQTLVQSPEILSFTVESLPNLVEDPIVAANLDRAIKEYLNTSSNPADTTPMPCNQGPVSEGAPTDSDFSSASVAFIAVGAVLGFLCLALAFFKICCKKSDGGYRSLN